MIMGEKLDLTVIILTKNEEANIEKSLKSINSIAKRIIVIDSGSIDKTEEICKKYNVDFYFNEWINHANQFNWGLQNLKIETEWILRLDADEVLSEKLQEELKIKLSQISKDISAIKIKIKIYFLGKWIKHGGIYPLSIIRLFRKNKVICEEKEMDEKLVVLEGGIKEFTSDIEHYDFKNLDFWISKHNWYSTKEMKNFYEIKNKNMKKRFPMDKGLKRKIKEKGYYNLPIFLRAHLYFIYRYYFRLGFLDGAEGKIFHFLQAYWYRFLVDAKIYEAQKVKK